MTTNQAERSARLRLKRQAAAAAATATSSASSKRLRSSTPPPPEITRKLESPAASGSGTIRTSLMKEALPSKSKKALAVEAEAEPLEEEEMEEEEEQKDDAAEPVQSQSPKKRITVPKPKSSADDEASECRFIGDPVPPADAEQRWPERYSRKNGRNQSLVSSTSNGSDGDKVKAVRHYLKASVDNCIYSLLDDAYVKAGEGEDDYIGRIVEFFEGEDSQFYFTAQWFFRAKDTVIKEQASCHDERRVFLSEEKNDNMLDCIVSKVKIVRLSPDIDLARKEDSIPPCDLYYDMSYSLPYSSFSNLTPEGTGAESADSSVISTDGSQKVIEDEIPSDTSSSVERIHLSLLDMYSGCGAMSTGLCLGANISNIDLVTRWAVDLNRYACESLKLNHPQAQVRNERAEDFLALIKEWEKLCKKFSLIGTESSFDIDSKGKPLDGEDPSEGTDEVPRGEFEVGKLVSIRYGDPNDTSKAGIQFKVRWKGYGPADDTWEPIEGLSKCRERIGNFVREGYKKRILPLPGCADVICGGPPCQGISGFNRFRKQDAPLEDTKNQQMIFFMDIVEYLKPKYVLMENVVDILKFAHGFLGRYALSRLVQMNYQARLGIMAAGSYGLPQFRMRCFLWGAQPSHKLPPFPLPTHDVVVRGGAPNEFEQNVVAYDENQRPELEKALLLGAAISDLPPVQNDENRDDIAYERAPKTDFQRFIRLGRCVRGYLTTKYILISFCEGSRIGTIKANVLGMTFNAGEKSTSSCRLFDHMPLQLNEDDYQRVCQIPKRKGANFRDLKGVAVGPDNVVQWDPNIPRVLLSSGKPLVPDYAMSFIKGKSPKPFGRLWWDETVPTVVTRAEPHNQVILHPDQDRVLTIRENARLQGFPDHYRLRGPVKERYIQVGNAVAVPVSRALGYALGLAYLGEGTCRPLLTLPAMFPRLHQEQVPSRAADSGGATVE